MSDQQPPVDSASQSLRREPWATPAGRRRLFKAGPAAAIGRRVRPVAVIATLVVLVGAASAYAAVGATRSKRPAPPPATTSLTSSTALDQDLSGQTAGRERQRSAR